MPTDTLFERRLHAIYAVSVPAELDRRVATAITSVPVHRSGRIRPRRLAVLAIAAIFAITAAGPAFEWFEGWSAPFDRLWEISTPVDQTVTADGYRVTVHRAYADRLGVRLAMTVDDVKNRWSGLYIEAADVTDGDGRVYEGWNWSGSRTPVERSSATWSRFLLPADALGDDLELRVTVTSLAVRAPESIPSDVDPERIWTSVDGAWTFGLDVPITRGQAVSPAATATANGAKVGLKELGVVPSGTVVRLAVEGLPEAPTLYGWLPSTTIEHDGVALSDQPFEPGVVGSDGVVTIEALPDGDDVAGHWAITVHEFYAFEPTLGQSRHLEGPWVLEFDVRPTP